MEQTRNENSWTVAIDLKMNMGEAGPHNHGAEQLSRFVQDLQKESKDKPVALVVQVSEAEDRSRAQGPDHPISRYLVKDGEVKPLAPPTTTDPSGLTADLVRFAGSTQASTHLGLVIFSHGFGSHGLGSDQGKISLDELRDSVQSALNDQQRPKLDLLGFDGCSMSQVDTLAAVSPIAENVVASTEYMTCNSDQICGIDLKGWLGTLMEHPSMSGKELAEKAVGQVKRSFEEFGAGTASPTLTNFDMSEYSGFKSSFDNFSGQLIDALQNPSNKQELQKLADTAPGYERYYVLDPPYVAPKDLANFANDVNIAIGRGEISDPTGQLQRAAEGLLTAEKNMIHTYFGSEQNTVLDAPDSVALKNLPVQAQKKYSQLGGLSVSLPDSDQISSAKKQGHSYQQLIEEETTNDLISWRNFLRQLRS